VAFRSKVRVPDPAPAKARTLPSLQALTLTELKASKEAAKLTGADPEKHAAQQAARAQTARAFENARYVIAAEARLAAYMQHPLVLQCLHEPATGPEQALRAGPSARRQAAVPRIGSRSLQALEGRTNPLVQATATGRELQCQAGL
jgi:hypothetical protein